MDTRTYAILLIGCSPDIPPLFEYEADGPEWVLQEARCIESAVALVKRREYDLVLADCRHSGLEPVETLQRLREIRPGIKVIILAPDSTANTVIAALKEHAFSYFGEPFDPHAVRSMVGHALEVPTEWDDGITVISDLPEFLSLAVRCQIRTADRLHQFFHEMKTELPAEERNQLALAFREMLLNAVEHGGGLNPNMLVRVSRIRTNRTIVYHIQDPGPGFSRDNLAHAAIANETGDPVKHLQVRVERGMRAGGFGMLITKQMVDEVIYNRKGNEVILIKHLD